MKLELPDDVVDAIAARAAELALKQLGAAAAAPELMTVPEAAELLRCRPQRIYELTADGRLAKLKDGSRVLIRRVDALAYLGAGEDSPGQRARKLRAV